jgi:hypothetical protein
MKLTKKQLIQIINEEVIDFQKYKAQKEKKALRDIVMVNMSGEPAVYDPRDFMLAVVETPEQQEAIEDGDYERAEELGVEFRDVIDEFVNEADPKKGTGKKPKGSGRRLYTDEDPSDTVSVKFSTVQDIKDTLSKASFKSKSHKRQSQIINLIHQRVRAAYNNAKDSEVKSRLKKAYDYAKKRKEASKKKTQAMKKGSK